VSRPEVLLLALCENAELDETGEPTLEGVFHRIGFHRLPAAKERVVIAVELWGTPSLTVDLVLRLVGPSYPDSATLPPFPVEIPEKGNVSFGAQFDQVPFTHTGVHALEALLDGVLLARRRFLVELFPPTMTAP